MFFLVFQIAAKIDTKLTLETKNGKNVSFNQTKFDQSLRDQSFGSINCVDQSLCDQSPLVINFFEINCVAINPADTVDLEEINHIVIDTKY
jgi:hypothetical protein